MISLSEALIDIAWPSIQLCRIDSWQMSLWKVWMVFLPYLWHCSDILMLKKIEKIMRMTSERSAGCKPHQTMTDLSSMISAQYAD